MFHSEKVFRVSAVSPAELAPSLSGVSASQHVPY
jgi:hypothetical protein